MAPNDFYIPADEYTDEEFIPGFTSFNKPPLHVDPSALPPTDLSRRGRPPGRRQRGPYPVTFDYTKESLGIRRLRPPVRFFVEQIVVAALRAGAGASDAAQAAYDAYQELDLRARDDEGNVWGVSDIRLVRKFTIAAMETGAPVKIAVARAVMCVRELKMRVGQIAKEGTVGRVTRNPRVKPKMKRAAKPKGDVK